MPHLPELPITQLKDAFLQALEKDNRFLIKAPTGSGKSTQIPQYLLEATLPSSGKIAVLQPRRIAARMLAKRVAWERDQPLGQEVGYHVRLDRVESEATRLQYVTEGILLRKLLDDPALNDYAALVFDEFHERHLYGDLSLGRALMIQKNLRPDLKLIVMSATLEQEVLHQALAPVSCLQSEGRCFPVEIHYAPKPSEIPLWEQAAEAFETYSSLIQEGHTLIFMPGAYEIKKTIDALHHTRAARSCQLLPLHGELPLHQQDEALDSQASRKIVVATNVAETSLTVDGVTLVIDSGLARIPRMDPRRGINTLFIEPISQASAQQRTGRAGRTAPGLCVRLWTEKEQSKRLPHTAPEIQRLDLSEAILTLKAGGILDKKDFPWIDPPEEHSWQRSHTLLTDLGALNLEGQLTPLGRKMVTFPLHPRYARMLLAADELGCVRPVALIAALTQGRSLLQRCESKKMEEDRDDFLGGEITSDFFRLMRAWRWAEMRKFDHRACRKLGIHAHQAREVGKLFRQLLETAQKAGLSIDAERADEESIRRCLLLGFVDHLAKRIDQGTLRCDLGKRGRGLLARESVVRQAEWMVAAEIREIEGKDTSQVLLHFVTQIEPAWLKEYFPQGHRTVTEVDYHPTSKRVIQRHQTLFRDWILSTHENQKPSEQEAATLLAQQVLEGKCRLNHWDDAAEQWIHRVNFLAQTRPELEIPPFTQKDRSVLLEQICYGALSAKEIKDRPVKPLLNQWLSPSLHPSLDYFAPSFFSLPSGRRAKITYRHEAEPFLAAPLQHFFGMKETLTLVESRHPLLLHILAPNQRLLQATKDLTSFWKEDYPALRKTLCKKYPKHEWPEQVLC